MSKQTAITAREVSDLSAADSLGVASDRPPLAASGARRLPAHRPLPPLRQIQLQRLSAPDGPVLRPGTSTIRVLLYGGATAFQCPGGGEVQLVNTATHLRKAGLQAKLFNPWVDKLRDADCLHLFGTLPEHGALVEAARSARIPIVLSPIAWYDLRACWHLAPSLKHGMLQAGRFLARAALPRLPSWRRRLYQQVDLLMPNSRAEGLQLRRYFQVPHDKIHIVPNAADAGLRDANPELFPSIFGVRDYVLYPGRIEPRKNQLGFLDAMQRSSLPIVILGDVVPAHRNYQLECRRAAGPNVHFVPALEPTNPLLGSAYRASACVVLASWFETPGLAALEAALVEVPVVVTRRGCAAEYFGRAVQYVNPRRPAEIRRAVEKALADRAETEPQRRLLAQRVQRRYHWDRVARICKEAYAKVLS